MSVYKKIFAVLAVIFAFNAFADEFDENAGDYEANELEIYDMDNYGKAAEVFEKLCAKKDALACFNLAELHFSGRGEDNLEAVELYEKSCYLGEIRGCNVLGFIYLNGDGVEQNSSLAIKFYEKSCDMNASTCGSLGKMYHDGYGVGQDYLKAVEFYEKSCEGKNAYNCNDLAILYKYGIGIAKNRTKALEYYEKACSLEHQEACKNYEKLKKEAKK
jgi:TPR repeat protein